MNPQLREYPFNLKRYKSNFLKNNPILTKLSKHIHGCPESYSVSSNPVYVTHLNRGLVHTHIVTGEYCNVVADHCIDHKTFL